MNDNPRIILINLPYKNTVIRRFQCSFNSHSFLFPPLELLYIAGALKSVKIDDCKIIDCIAEKINIDELTKKIENFQPDYLITMPGFEIFGDDIKSIKLLKSKFQTIKFILFGYYPSIFYNEILAYTGADFIAAGEPEHRIIDIIKNRSSSYSDGIIRKNENKKNNYNSLTRITNLDELPYPDYSQINIKSYSEPFRPKPFATIYTSRGCAYNCSYCIHSYGKNYLQMSASAVVDKIEKLTICYNLKSLRFMDDNFTTDRQRTIEICNKLIEKNIYEKIGWSCLSRIDTLDEELIKKMADAGCKRIYIGIETLDNTTQKIYNKEYITIDTKKINVLLKEMKAHSIESFSFLMIDFDNYNTLKTKINDFLKLNLDFISVCKLVIYPETKLFNYYKDKIQFNIIPYKNTFIDNRYEMEAEKMERYALIKFYTQPKNILKSFVRLLKYPRQSLLILLNFLKFYFSKQENKRDFI